MSRLREIGKEELGVSLSESVWNQALIRVNKSSSCSRLSIIQFKVLPRLHYCNSKLSKIYPNVQDSCNQLPNSPADLKHMFWSFPQLDYWNGIFKFLSESLNLNLQPNVSLCIFGAHSDKDPDLNNKH